MVKGCRIIKTEFHVIEAVWCILWQLYVNAIIAQHFADLPFGGLDAHRLPLLEQERMALLVDNTQLELVIDVERRTLDKVNAHVEELARMYVARQGIIVHQ